jgi:ASC-1-like (ASCH) protein
MKHHMHLQKSPFQRIKEGTKKYEIRLNDKKRQQRHVGDLMQFQYENESLTVEVLALEKYKDVQELAKGISKLDMGINDKESLQEIIYTFYSKEQIKKEGILTIEIKIITLNDLEKILKKSWSKETCHIPLQEKWTTNKPELGQCAVTVLVIHDYFDGEIAHDIHNKHYWNIINGKNIDITRNQFPKETIFNIDEIVSRESLFSEKSKTQERYQTLLENIKNQ